MRRKGALASEYASRYHWSCAASFSCPNTPLSTQARTRATQCEAFTQKLHIIITVCCPRARGTRGRCGAGERGARGGRRGGGRRSPCSFFSVSQNFCSSVKYLSSMNTLERPSVAMAGGALASHSAAAPHTSDDDTAATTRAHRHPRTGCRGTAPRPSPLDPTTDTFRRPVGLVFPRSFSSTASKGHRFHRNH